MESISILSFYFLFYFSHSHQLALNTMIYYISFLKFDLIIFATLRPCLLHFLDNFLICIIKQTVDWFEKWFFSELISSLSERIWFYVDCLGVLRRYGARSASQYLLILNNINIMPRKFIKFLSSNNLYVCSGCSSHFCTLS